MAKRNKPIIKHRKPGTQWGRRRKYGADYERQMGKWVLLVPETAGIDRYELPRLMVGAIPTPMEETWGRRACRWRLDVGGRSWTVWSVEGRAVPSRWWGEGRLPWGLGNLADKDTRWLVYEGERRCSQGANCPEAYRYFADNGVSEITRHRPGSCPFAVRESGAWKFVGAAHRRGDDWYI